ncbi:MAG: hypothetical protein JXR78_16280 [Victivallales bacterium]|nr:hypothetical protein [Victivallales bacterium]
MSIKAQDYVRTLEKWLVYAEKAIYQPLSQSDMACYGPGNHGHWSLQSNTTAFGAFAVLASDPDFDEVRAGMSRERALNIAHKLLNFTLRSHHSGGGATFDGESWGHSWISALCIERMMHGVEALDAQLTNEQRELLRGMLISESDWILNYPVEADLDASTGNNRPESNIWNGALLHRTAMMYPDCSGAENYRRKGTEFILNGISLPSDLCSDMIIAGRKLSEWCHGANFTGDFGLNHHGYLNVGYMVICLSNIAMLHFSYKKRGIAAPEELYHHALKLWQVIKNFTFADGRLWRIGGDSRVRYCYCQDYAIPMWLLAKDLWNDPDCDAFEAGWLDIVRMEMADNGDGSFLGGRLEELKAASPLYFQRLEGDKAVTLSMGAYWTRLYGFDDIETVPEFAPECGWHDEYHGALMQRGKKRMTSFVWDGSGKSMAMCLPADDSSMAEWRQNLIGQIDGCGAINRIYSTTHKDYVFEGGFNTCGRALWQSQHHVAEGQADEDTALEDIAFAALPDDCTVVVMQRAKTINRVYLKTVKGVFCNIPNDVFNNYTRHYNAGGNALELKGNTGKSELIRLDVPQVEIDGMLSLKMVYGADELFVNRPSGRQVRIQNPPVTYGRSGGNLFCDELCVPCELDMQDYEPESVLFDLGFVMRAGAEAGTTDASAIMCSSDDVRAILTRGADGHTYLFAACFGEAQSVELMPGHYTSALRLDTGENLSIRNGTLRLDMHKHGSMVLRLS